MTSEQAYELYWSFDCAAWKAHAQPLVQKELELARWDRVLSVIRKDYEEENERLRRQNRDLSEALATAMRSLSETTT